MNFSIIKLPGRQKLLLFVAAISIAQIDAISSNMTHRTMSASPLLYKMINYGQEQNCYEIEPIYMSMYDQDHTMANLMPEGKKTLQFSQLGTGDLNPAWLQLMSNNTLANYNSQVTFDPKLTQSGALFHWYDQFDNMFIELKTALVQCKSEITITEIGGGNGLNPGVLNAQQAFNQSDWNFGKIGTSNHVVGLDDIELRLGHIYKATSNASTYNLLFSGFAIIQAPTGTGTKAEWLFEPQVGTNHWNLGLGFENLVAGDNDINFMIGANYRYAIPAWEIRSFDLENCGSWSRYLGVQDIYGLPTAPATLPLPGINFMTQQAYIQGRSQFNFYTRMQKQFRNNYFELSYNFLCVQKETIGAIKNLPAGFGIYAMTGETTGAGGVTTAPQAFINENITPLDPLGKPQTISTANFDKQSACATTYASNNLTARLEIKNKNAIYGFGASIDAALSASALSTWSVWAQFGLLFGSGYQNDDNFDEITPSHLYDYDQEQDAIVAHNINMDQANLPEETVTTIQDDFINNTDAFEYGKEAIEELEVQAQEIIALEHDQHQLAGENGMLLLDLDDQKIHNELTKNPVEIVAHHGLAMPTKHEQLVDAIFHDQTVDMNSYEIVPNIQDGLDFTASDLQDEASIKKMIEQHEATDLNELTKNPVEIVAHHGFAMPTKQEQLDDLIFDDQTVDMNSYEIVPKIQDGLDFTASDLQDEVSIKKMMEQHEATDLNELTKNPVEIVAHHGLAMPTKHEQLVDAIFGDQTVDMNSYEIVPNFEDGLDFTASDLQAGASIKKVMEHHQATHLSDEEIDQFFYHKHKNGLEESREMSEEEILAKLAGQK